MTSSIFREWLARFDRFIGCSTRKRTLLLVDNVSCHSTIDNMTNLNYVRVKFLPKRTTPFLQPLDAGLIACAKRRFARRQAERAIDLIEHSVVRDLYRIDLKMAIEWIYGVWYQIEDYVFRNCWRKTGIIDSSF